MISGTRLALVGIGLALALFVAGFAVIPIRVSYGAGSVRCGTVLHPDRGADEVCPSIGRQRLKDSAVVGLVFAAAPIIPLGFRRMIKHVRVVRVLLLTALLTFWIIATPLAVYFLTGTYSTGQ